MAAAGVPAAATSTAGGSDDEGTDSPPPLLRVNSVTVRGLGIVESNECPHVSEVISNAYTSHHEKPKTYVSLKMTSPMCHVQPNVPMYSML